MNTELAGLSSLSSLLGREVAGRFMAQCWPDRLFHVQADPSTWPEFLRLRAWSDPYEIDALYRGPIDVTRGALAQYRVEGVPVSGCVIDLRLATRLSELERWLPGAAPWVATLEHELGVPAGSGHVNAFINPPGVGLGTHCDPVEHLMIHVAGEKTIRVLPNPAGSHVSASHALSFTPSSRESVQYPDGLPAWSGLAELGETIVLRPGSVLFMPRGTYHETVGGEGGVSASLVVQFEIPNLAELTLDYLREYLLQDPRWRTPAAGAWGTSPEPATRLHAELESLLGELGQRLRELTLARIFATHKRRFTAETIRPDDRFMRNPSLHVAVQEDGVILLTSHRGRGRTSRVTLGAATAAVTQALASGSRPFGFGEVVARFDDWEDRSLAEIVAFLVRKEVLVALTPEPWIGSRSPGEP